MKDTLVMNYEVLLVERVGYEKILIIRKEQEAYRIVSLYVHGPQIGQEYALLNTYKTLKTARIRFYKILAFLKKQQDIILI